MRLLRALLCAVSVAGLAACAGTNAATDGGAPAGLGPDLSQPFTGLPGLSSSTPAPAAVPAVASAEPAAPPPAASSKRQQQQRRPQAGYRGAATQVAAPEEPSDEPELTPEQQVYKFKGQCWMETEKQRNANIDKRIELVDKCLAAKMKAANIKAN
ncbi:MAG: hypothetical protein AB1490_01605 [Pseudomonadota bacterium]